jgi:hypothetical protein
MNQLVPITSPTLPALIAAAGERASMPFLEFFAANIRNPHTPRLCARRRWFPGLACERRGAVDRRRPAGACRGVDRGVDARAGGAVRQATACRDQSPVRLAGDGPGGAGQSASVREPRHVVTSANIAPSWNVAPTDSLPAVCFDSRAGERSLAEFASVEWHAAQVDSDDAVHLRGGIFGGSGRIG